MNRMTRIMAVFAGLCLSAATMAQAPEARDSITSQGQGIERGGIDNGSLTWNRHDPLQTTGGRDKTGGTRGSEKLSSGDTLKLNTEFWFYEVDVQLFADDDRDGFYHGIDLWFDADTIYTAADVYAVVYLSYEYGPWNEYAETEDFTLFGTSGSDNYVIETELVSGYPTGSYDILIELYDAWDSTLLAVIGPEDAADLSLLPLEDANRDAPFGGSPQVVVNSGGGGAVGWFLLLGLLAVRMTLRPQAARLSK